MKEIFNIRINKIRKKINKFELDLKLANIEYILMPVVYDATQVTNIINGFEKLEYTEEELENTQEILEKLVDDVSKYEEVKKILIADEEKGYSEKEEMSILTSEKIKNGINDLFTNNLKLNKSRIAAPKSDIERAKCYLTLQKGYRYVTDILVKEFEKYKTQKQTNLEPLDIYFCLELIADASEECVAKWRETLVKLSTGLIEPIIQDRKIYVERDAETLKSDLKGIFFEAKNIVAEKLAEEFVIKFYKEKKHKRWISIRPHWKNIFKKYLNEEYNMNLPLLLQDDSFIPINTKNYQIIYSRSKVFMDTVNLDEQILYEACELINQKSNLDIDFYYKIVDWANLYYKKNKINILIDDFVDFMAKYIFKGFSKEMNINAILQLLKSEGIIKSKNILMNDPKKLIFNFDEKRLVNCARYRDEELLKKLIHGNRQILNLDTLGYLVQHREWRTLDFIIKILKNMNQDELPQFKNGSVCKLFNELIDLKKVEVLKEILPFIPTYKLYEAETFYENEDSIYDRYIRILVSHNKGADIFKLLIKDVPLEILFYKKYYIKSIAETVWKSRKTGYLKAIIEKMNEGDFGVLVSKIKTKTKKNILKRFFIENNEIDVYYLMMSILKNDDVSKVRSIINNFNNIELDLEELTDNEKKNILMSCVQYTNFELLKDVIKILNISPECDVFSGLLMLNLKEESLDKVEFLLNSANSVELSVHDTNTLIMFCMDNRRADLIERFMKIDKVQQHKKQLSKYIKKSIMRDEPELFKLFFANADSRETFIENRGGATLLDIAYIAGKMEYIKPIKEKVLEYHIKNDTDMSKFMGRKTLKKLNLDLDNKRKYRNSILRYETICTRNPGKINNLML